MAILSKNKSSSFKYLLTYKETQSLFFKLYEVPNKLAKKCHILKSSCTNPQSTNLPRFDNFLLTNHVHTLIIRVVSNEISCLFVQGVSQEYCGNSLNILASRVDSYPCVETKKFETCILIL